MTISNGNSDKQQDSVVGGHEKKPDEENLEILTGHQKISLKKTPSRWSSLCDKTLWDWLKLAIIPLGGVIVTAIWNVRAANEATQRYNAQLVKDYIDSVKELILDQYHHGKDAKYPEISVEEVEAFVRAKTSNTLKALEESKPQNWVQQYITFPLGNIFIQYPFLRKQKSEKQNLVNFLIESGVGFFPPRQVEKAYINNYLQNVCPEDNFTGYQRKSHAKDVTFYHFFCGINLIGVDLNQVDLNMVIFEKANLKDAKFRDADLWQADLQGANLVNADLSNANLSKANLKGVTMTGATLENATLNNANLRDAWLWMDPAYLPENCELENPQTDQASTKSNLQLEKTLEPKCKNPEKREITSLRGAKLVGANLQGADLRKVDFSNAKMTPFISYYRDPKIKKYIISKIIPTNLRNSKLEGADLSGTDLTQANLRGANLTNAKIDRRMRITKLKQALYDEYTTRLPFSKNYAAKKGMIEIYWGENLSNKDLSYDDLRFAFRCKDKNTDKFIECDNSIKEETYFYGTDLRGADLRGADLSHAKIDKRTKLQDALYDQYTDLPLSIDNDKARNRGMIKLEQAANLRGVDLSYVDLSGVDLSNSQLQGAKLISIDFDENTNFKDAEHDKNTRLPFDPKTALFYRMRYAPHGDVNDSIKTLPFSLQIAVIHDMMIYKSQPPVDWSRENHQQGDLRRALLRYANFEDIILTKAMLENADLTGANLTNADLTGANLQGADLTNANLTNADLTDADLRRAKLKNVKWDRAMLCRTKLPLYYTLPKDADRRNCIKSHLEIDVNLLPNNP